MYQLGMYLSRFECYKEIYSAFKKLNLFACKHQNLINKVIIYY